MNIESLDLKNFRNYSILHIEFDPETNILYGDNAQGKTNILEAVYLTATTKSHRGSRDREIIRFGEEESHIKVKVSKRGIPYVIDVHLKKERTKGIAINGIPVRKASEIFGIVNVVCFSPEDLEIIKEGPAVRRKFIDLELCQLNPLYVHSLVSYNRILVQKNKLLKELAFHRDYEETLDVWDEQLIRYGNEVTEYRERFIEEINEIIEGIHSNISGEKEKIKITYEKCGFAINRKEEIRAKTSLCGPHRDDIVFYINGEDVRKFGSQGQQRTAALSLKLAEIELMKRKIKDTPVLLLDDVLSELDESRQDRLLTEIKDIQTIITCTGLEDYLRRNFRGFQAMHVSNGKVEEALNHE